MIFMFGFQQTASLLCRAQKRQREQQLRCRVSGFTPCGDPLAIELRSADKLNLKRQRVAARHLQSDLKPQRIRGQALPFTGVYVGVGVFSLRVQLNTNFVTQPNFCQLTNFVK